MSDKTGKRVVGLLLKRIHLRARPRLMRIIWNPVQDKCIFHVKRELRQHVRDKMRNGVRTRVPCQFSYPEGAQGLSMY